MNWQARIDEALLTGRLVVTQEEYEEIVRDTAAHAPPRGAWASALNALSVGTIGQMTGIRLVMAGPEPVSGEERRAAAEAQARMEAGFALGRPVPAPPPFDIAEWLARHMEPPPLVPSNICRITNC